MVVAPIVSGLRMVIAGGAAAATELLGGKRPRRRWSGNGRAWIELRMPAGSRTVEYAAVVEKAIGSVAGVARTQLNWPLSRLVVDIGENGPTVERLVLMVEAIERVFAEAAARDESSCESGPEKAGGFPVLDIPGDAAEVVNRVSLLAAKVTALGVSAALQVARAPRLPRAFAAATTFAEAQPDVRRIFERALGRSRADAVLALGTSVTQSLGHTPSVIAADILMRSLRLIEALAAVDAWKEHEPQLALSAQCEPQPESPRPRPLPDTASENYARAATAAGLAGAVALLVSGGAHLASEAVIVAAPRALNYARESFATTFCAGLNRNHHTLVLRSDALRCLDGIDVLIVDPAVLIGESLRVAQVNGVDGELHTKVWQCAQTDVDAGLLDPGVHTGCSLSPAHELPDLRDVEIVVTRTADPFAEPLIAAARGADLKLVSVDQADPGHLRGTFDELVPADEDVDLAMCDAVRRLQRDGKVVAVVGRDLRHAFGAADLSLAVWDAERPPAWTADVLLPSLKVACRIVDAIPAAKSAARRGVELAAAGTVLGMLTLLPGVRAAGVRPSIAAAALALIPGYVIARGVAMQADPDAATDVEWHALDSDQAQEQIRILRPDLANPGVVAVQPPKSRLYALVAGFAESSKDVVEAMWHEMQDPLTPILATGALASALIGSPIDGALVGIVLLGSAGISAAQRLSSDRQLTKMLSAQTPPARITTEPDQFELVETEQLTPGTIIEVRAGEVVPADARVLSAIAVEVDESSLTGESLPVTKHPAPTPGRPLAERACMIYEGSTVLSGVCRAVVVAVGGATAAGRAMALAPRRRDEVGLHAQLAGVTAKVLPWTLTGGAGVVVTALLRGSGIKEAVTSGVYCAVAAVPEGLPLVATLAQREAARRLTQRNVLVRAPRSVETLGRVEVVCFDKTGTLSENRLVVTEISGQPSFDDGVILERAALATPVALHEQAPLQATDAAVVNRAGSQPKRNRELPFRAGRAYAAGLDGQTLAVKGSPEVVLSACVEAQDDAAREALLTHVHRMATRGLRVIAVADRVLTDAELAIAEESGLEPLCGEGLRLLGFLGITDTPRADARELLLGLAKRDIGVRVITGDHPATARAIARQIGLDVPDECVITGARWERLSIAERAEVVKDNVIYARMTPEQKVQIVQQISQSGRICAMVGDGANDAAAIRAAAVGVGVSSHGSDPARGAADVVLTEGRVGSLLIAIEEGHRLWQQAQAAVAMLLGGNTGEIAFNMYGTMVRGVAPLTARQILLVNILTDVFPTTAVAVSAVRNMRPPSQRGINMDDLAHTVAIRGAATTIGASLSWSLATFTRANPQRAATVGLVGLVTTQLGQTLLESRDPLVIGTCAGTFLALAALITTPGLSQLVGCVPLGPLAWIEGVAPAAALTVLTAAKPDLLLRMASTIGSAVSKYASRADRRLTNVVESLSTWAQELPGAESDRVDDWEWEPHFDLRPAS